MENEKPQSYAVEVLLHEGANHQYMEDAGKWRLVQNLLPLITSGDWVCLRYRTERIPAADYWNPRSAPVLRMDVELKNVEVQQYVPEFPTRAHMQQDYRGVSTRKLLGELKFRLMRRLKRWERYNWLARRAQQVDQEKAAFGK